MSGFFVHVDLSIGLFFFSVYELKKFKMLGDEALESLTHGVEVGYVFWEVEVYG